MRLKTVTLEIHLDRTGYSDDDIARLRPDLERDLAKEVQELGRRIGRKYGVTVQQVERVEWITVKQAALELKVSARRVIALINDKRLPATRPGRRAWRVKREDLDLVRDRKPGRPGWRKER